MTDDLRTRIIAALLSEDDVALMADAVIAELNLERQDHYDPHCDYYRYVTDWIAPND